MRSGTAPRGKSDSDRKERLRRTERYCVQATQALWALPPNPRSISAKKKQLERVAGFLIQDSHEG